jgi:ASC-1-like (ASCH) protein
MAQTIEKKILPEYFEKIKRGEKTFELRLADWECNQGDTLVLVEINAETKEPTGRTLKRKVGYVGKTKDFDFWTKEQVDQYGYQIISLLEEAE